MRENGRTVLSMDKEQTILTMEINIGENTSLENLMDGVSIHGLMAQTMKVILRMV